LAPASAGCIAWLNGACIDADSDYFRYHASSGFGRLQSNGDDDAAAMMRLLQLEEHAASGLFSEMNPMVICLVVQAVSLALSMGLLVDPTPLMQRGALGVVLLFGGLCLFMRERWQIPQNNLLWLEAVLALVFVLIGSRRGGASVLVMWGGGAADFQQQHVPAPVVEELDRAFRGLISPGITTPMVSVAVLALGGESDAAGLLLAYGGMCGVSLLWLIEHQLLLGYACASYPPPSLLLAASSPHAAPKGCGDVASGEETPPLFGIALVTRLNAWLCITPALVRVGMRLDAIMARLPSGAPPAPATWIVGALVLVLCWLLLTMAYLSLGSFASSSFSFLGTDARGASIMWFGSALRVGGHSALQWVLLLLVSICSLHQLMI
jgi:hypothetical protein